MNVDNVDPAHTIEKPDMVREASAHDAPPEGAAPTSTLPTLFPEHSNTAEHRMNEIPGPVGSQEGQSAHAAKLRIFGDAKEHLNSQLLRSPDEFANPMDYTRHLESIRQGLGAVETAKANYELERPWGSMESAHPGFFGKLGHAFGEIGNVAGEAMAPGLAQAIPGSHMNLEHQTEQGNQAIGESVKEQGQLDTGELKQAQGNLATEKATSEGTHRDLQQAQTDLANAKTEAMEPKAENQAIHDLMVGNEGGGPRVNPLTGKPYTYAEAYGAVKGLGKTPKVEKLQHVAGTLNGSPQMANFDPAKGEYTNPDTHEAMHGFKPAPNYAQVLPKKLETQTKDLVGPDGIAHQYGWNPETSRYDIDMGVSGTGQQGSRLFASGVSKAGGDALIADIQAHKTDLGNLEAWVKSYGLNTPIANAELAQLQAELASFAALQPAQHGFRATSAMEAFEKIIGGLQKNPDATIASIRGINEITSRSLPKTAPGGATPPSTPETGGRPSVADWLKSRKGK